MAIAAVTTGESLTEWTIRLDPADADHAVIDPIGLGVRLQRLGPNEQVRLGDLLAVTRADPVPAPVGWRVDPTSEPFVDDVPDTEWPAPTDAVADDPVDGAPVVAVLGPVEIHGPSELAEPTKRGQLTALAAFLALNPRQTRDAVDEAMWPGRRVSLSTRNTAMTKLRNWLGTNPDGVDYVPRAAADGYRLHPAVRTDWHRFTDLLPDGPAEATTENLIAALALVRGQPFAGVNPRRYIWAEGTQQEMIAAIVDVADELARRALHAGNHRLALKAVSVGLTADRGSEVLWRHRLRAHHAANDRDALEHAADQLTALADDLGGDLDDDTTELLTRLLADVPNEVTATRPGRHG